METLGVPNGEVIGVGSPTFDVMASFIFKYCYLDRCNLVFFKLVGVLLQLPRRWDDCLAEPAAFRCMCVRVNALQDSTPNT